MPSYIDQEVLTEILKRVPVKKLVQLRCVCKSWYALISSPSFISLHKNYTKYNNSTCCNSNNRLLLRHYSWTHKKEKYTVHDDSCNEQEEQEGNSFSDCQELVSFTFKSYSQYFEIVGSCNGLLCLSDTYRINSHTIILWNPAIRKSVTLPMPCITLDRIYMFVLGFGFDSKRNDYKVVRVVYNIGNHGCNVVVAPKVEVFELSKNSWRSIEVTTSAKYVISELSLQVFLNGAVHWIGYNPSEGIDGDFRDLSMVLFDMSTEEFSEMKLPDSIIGLSVLDLSIVASGKLLSLIQYNRHRQSQWIQYDSCYVWVMKEYGVIESWTKQYNVDLEGGLRKALGIRRNGEALLVASSGELVSYDLTNKQISHLGMKGVAHSFYLDVYIETLVLLEGRQ